jgi:hypothetical protein
MTACSGVSFQDNRHSKYQNARRNPRLEPIAHKGAEAESPSTAPGNMAQTAPAHDENAFLPYYDQLDDAEKHVYNLVYDAYMTGETTVEFPFTIDETSRPVWSVMNDHPEIFWMRQDHQSVVTDFGNGTYKTTLKLRYEDFGRPIADIQDEIEDVIHAWFPNIHHYQTPYEIEKYIHDQIIIHTDYTDHANYRHSIYSVFIDKKALCEGYARAFQYILLRSGIDAVYIPGTNKGEGHSWVQVYIDGACYNVDVTDDVLKPDSARGNKSKMPAYFKFNLTDEEIRQIGYLRDSDADPKEVKLPVCNSKPFSFENTFGNYALQEVYGQYLHLPRHHVVGTREQHNEIMLEAGKSANSAQYRVFEIVTSPSLMRELYNLDSKANAKGYYDALWKTKFNQYEHHRSAVSYTEVTKTSSLAYFDEFYY